MTSIVAQLIEDNLTVLGQGRALVEGLDDAQFTENAPTLALSGVGPHLRHVVDFYERFLDAVESPEAEGGGEALVRVDYDARQRDRRVEVDPAHALRTIEQMLSRLRALRSDLLDAAPADDDAGIRLLVRSDGSPWVDSNVCRELQSLVSHTVHHYALIAIAVRSQGGDPGAEFGVAPSTLRHWEAVKDSRPNGAPAPSDRA